MCCVISATISPGSHFLVFFVGEGMRRKRGAGGRGEDGSRAGPRNSPPEPHFGASLSAKPVCSPTTSIRLRAPPLSARPGSPPLGASPCPTTLDLGLDDVLGMAGQVPEAEPRLPPAGRAHPSPRPEAKGSPGRDAPAPSPSPDRLPHAALAEATALAPEHPLPSLTETQQAAALTDREGGRGPARQRRGWGGGGDSGSAAPDPARSRAPARLRPLSRRPCPGGRTAASRGRRARRRRCGGSWPCVASRGSERLPAPPSRAGTARSDVSAAPPAPHPDQCGMEGAEASREGRPARRPGASSLRPACLPAFPGDSRRHSSPSLPPHRRSSGLEASLAALSSGIRAASGRMESSRDGRPLSERKGGVLPSPCASVG